MATIEKLVKAFEGLKVFQPMGLTVEDVTKKKDQPPTKKEKTQHCNMVADCICAPNMRSIPDFPKFLGIAMEAFLTLCDDAEADVRMVADECLNRTIKTLLETNLGRLQVELYKEVKKNGPSRTLRAALWRFANMCHLIRPQKCRPYIVNLMPCIGRICRREEEAIQETLSTAMLKICPVLMSFANDAEVKSLLRAFLPNLGSTTAVTRRTAATSLSAMCQYSRSPNFFSKWLLEALMGSLLPASQDYEVPKLLGIIQCLRYLLPLIVNPDVKDEGMKGSFGVMRSEREATVTIEQLLQVYELLLYHTRHRDHNVVTASLEALHQLLRRPHPQLLPILSSPNSIKNSTIYDDQSKTLGRSRADSNFAGLPSASEDLEDDMDSEAGSAEQGASVLQETESGEGSEEGETSGDQEQQKTTDGDEDNDDESAETAGDDPPVFMLNDSSYSNVEIGDVNEDKSERSEKSQLSHSSSQDTLLSIRSLSPKRVPSLRPGLGEDMNGNPEYDPDCENIMSEPSSPYPGGAPSSCLGDIGTFVDGEVPFLYCTRLLCQQFLLAGRKGELIPDKAVRISSKSLALSCIASITTMYPTVFFYRLFVSGETDNQNLQDILLYAKHSDPQLKGQTGQIIGNYLQAAHLAGGGSFQQWNNSVKVTDAPALTLDELLGLMTSIIEDDSSMAARMGLVAFKLCLPDLLRSSQCHRALQVLLKLIELQHNPYWLVKVELLELLGDINFKIICYLETAVTKFSDEMGQCIGELHIQERVLHDVILNLLGDEDSRVRHSAASMLVRLVPRLFYKADNPQESPVIGSAKEMAENFLSPIMYEWSDELPPLVLGLSEPYNHDTKHHPPVDMESNLSRVISVIVQKLNQSQSKYLTYGCCHALSLLVDAYMVTQYPHPWGCGPPMALSARDSPRGPMKKPSRRSLSTSSTISFDEFGTGSGGGPLSIILSVLTSSSISLDLSSHQDALHVAGHLFAGASYKCLRPAEETISSNKTSEEGSWKALSDRILAAKADQLLSHVAKLLNACTHVIDEVTPGPPQMKPSLPSLPNAPSLSPIKRRAKGDKDASNQNSPSSTPDGKNTPKQTNKDKEKDSDKEKNKKDGIGTFYNLPHYMKLHEVLKGAYSNYKISLDLNSADKFCSLLRTALMVFSQILEVTSLQEVGKHADELLAYMKSTVLIEATGTVLCVQQLLKALFGTNLATQWEPPSSPSSSGKPGKATRLSANIHPGLYHSCFTTPYTHFTQSLAGATFKATTQMDQEDNSSPLSWLRKRVERKIPAILRPSSKADKNAITSYIRLFEPLVIKALKQYTVTSSVELQTQVLDLLSQLIQLRVNYCLLDSDQIFIGFVIKQFEFIEEGQIRSSELIIPHIFQFLVILSYEKFHTKSIIGVPKIIQLCDGIMASGQQATTHVIPALRPIVHDLFLLRGNNKGEGGKELDTQREVVVSMLLRLISYYQVLELLTVVLHQYHKEGEDKWKRLSRQVTDLVLPLLTKQQVNLDCRISVDVLHRLFESVAPSVFRPVDSLLKALFCPPQDLNQTLNSQRWVGMILAVLRVLISQSKEEVILSRLQELRLVVTLFTDSGQEDNSPVDDGGADQPPEEVLAWYILQVVGSISGVIRDKCCSLSAGRKDCLAVCQGLAHLLLYLTHMFQSGLFRRVATAAMRVIHQATPQGYFSIQQVNAQFRSLGVYYPTLTLQWCNILILLNYDDQEWWASVMATPKKYMLSSQSLANGNHVEPDPAPYKCFSSEIIRRGSLILFCDYVCENLTDADHMIWVIINHVNELIELSHEPPVQDFISAVHRNSAASGLFIQAIHARCDNFTKPAQMKRSLQCLEAIHLSQSGTLLTLLIDKFLNTHHLAVARFCHTIACRRVEMLLAENLEDSTSQLPLEDLEKLLQFMKSHGLCKRHARLVSLLTKLRSVFCPESSLTLSPEKTHPLVLTSSKLRDISINKEWFISIVKEQCFRANPDSRECARLLQRLEYADTLAVIMTKEFHLTILKECISLSSYRTLVTYNRNQELREASPDGEAQPPQPTFDVLFQASQMALFRHVNNIVIMLPAPYQALPFDPRITLKGSQYSVRLEDFFVDSAWLESILQIAVTVLQYLRSLSQFPWQPAVPMESRSDICRFCLLCLEVIHWQLSTNHLPSSEQLETAIQCMAVCLQSPHLAAVFSEPEHYLWSCSVIGVIHQILSALVVRPGERLAVLPNQDHGEEPHTPPFDDSYYYIRACDEISELLHCLRTCLSQSDGGQGRIPDCLRLPIRVIAIGLARLPVVNTYARTPPLVWRMGWMPVAGGETKTRLPPLPLEYIQDKEVLREFIFRALSIGWTSRQQFEETWMALLGVLTPLAPEQDHRIAPEEDVERTQSMVLAVRAITGLLVQSGLHPQPGNPSNSGYEVLPRDKPLAILHTRCGKKLAMVRGLVERELRNLCTKRHGEGSTLTYNQDTDGLKFLFESNLERELGSEDYTLGQISIETIWTMIGLLDISASESESEESSGSPPKQTAQTPTTSSAAATPSPENKGSVSGLDIHSCLQLLLDLYGQWLAPNANPKTPLMLLNAVVKSVVCLSDLFSEVQQYEWMLSLLLDVLKSHPVEDELVNQYLIVGICKSSAVCGTPDSSATEKIIKVLDGGLKSTHLPSKVTSLHGILYLLEAGMSDLTKSVLSMTTDFLLKQLSAISLVCITSHQFVLTLWATAFYVIENYNEEIKEGEFQASILQMAVNTISNGEENISMAVYQALFRGLERLLLADVLTKQDADTLLKLAVDRLCLPSPVKALPALGLMLTCMYTVWGEIPEDKRVASVPKQDEEEAGKQFDQYSPAPRNTSRSFFDHDNDPFTIVYQDPESLILAMERVTVLFDRIKKGTPYEARVITRILPAFLADFFPPQDIMNKVIGEFISNQQPHPQLIAKVVFQVFSSLHQTAQHTLVQDWVMLSLSNFTQRTPVAMAVWSLTCFLISASTNPWLRGLLPHVIGRMGKLETVDRKFFCVAAVDFYRQLDDEAKKRAFLCTFQSVAQADSPYCDLLACFSGL